MDTRKKDRWMSAKDVCAYACEETAVDVAMRAYVFLPEDACGSESRT